MHNRFVGIAEIRISNNPSEVLIAPNLGSCLAVSVYDPVNRCGGMVHCLLPLSKADSAKAAQNPYTYVDSGVGLLLEKLLTSGVAKNKLSIVAAGCANINDQNNIFEIGKKNFTVLKKILWKNGLLLRAEHVGESVSRTFSLEISSGKTYLKFKNEKIEL